MDSRQIGLLVIGGGVLLIAAGALIYLGVFGWFGRLPGDVRLERGATRIYIPIASMIILSIALTLVLALARRFL
jgi:hypothetical protein